MLTFPADKSDFSAPNGVTYAWDGIDGKWRVKAFRSIDDFIVQLQDTAPIAEESKVGDLWFDTSDESLTLFVYTGDEWVPAAPPVSLDGINATIDAALIIQNDLLARVEAGEIVQTGVLDNITTLQNKVEALEGTVIDGKWMLDNRSVAREGYFLGLAGAAAVQDWTLVTRLQMNPVDSTGKSFTFAEVSIDDVVRIGGVGGNAVFKITSTFAQAGDVYEADVQLLSHSGVMAETLTYDFEFLPSFDPSTYATIDYVDAENAKYISKTGQQDLNADIWKVRQQNTQGNYRSFINIHDGVMNLYNVADPSDGADGWATNKKYVKDNFIGNQGTQTLDANSWNIRQPNSGGSTNNFIVIHDGSMNLYNVADPTNGADGWAANKKYVDDAVANADGGPAVEILPDTNLPARDRGTLVLSTDNKFYIYI